MHTYNYVNVCMFVYILYIYIPLPTFPVTHNRHSHLWWSNVVKREREPRSLVCWKRVLLRRGVFGVALWSACGGVDECLKKQQQQKKNTYPSLIRHKNTTHTFATTHQHIIHTHTLFHTLKSIFTRKIYIIFECIDFPLWNRVVRRLDRSSVYRERICIRMCVCDCVLCVANARDAYAYAIAYSNAYAYS